MTVHKVDLQLMYALEVPIWNVHVKKQAKVVTESPHGAVTQP